MTKTNHATRKSQTYFEQIPIDVVKKIAEEDVSKDKKAGTDNVNAGPTSRKSKPQSVPARSLDRNGR
jgi:hypothetical protein